MFETLNLNSDLLYKRPTVNPDSHLTKLRSIHHEIIIKANIVYAGLFTTAAGIGCWTLGAKEGGAILLSGIIPTLIELVRFPDDFNTGIRIISKTALQNFPKEHLPWSFRIFSKKPDTRLQNDLDQFAETMAYRNWADKVLEQREALYGKLDTGIGLYDPNKVATLPTAIKVAKIKPVVGRSIERIKSHINTLSQRSLELITKENAESIIDSLLFPLGVLEEHARVGQISREQSTQFYKSTYKFIWPFLKRATEIGVEKAPIYNLMGQCVWMFEEHSEQNIEIQRTFFRKAIKLDPEDTIALWNFGSTFMNCKIYSDFGNNNIEEVLKTWQKLLQQADSNPEVLNRIEVPEGLTVIKAIQEAIEKLNGFIQQRDKFKRLEGLINSD